VPENAPRENHRVLNRKNRYGIGWVRKQLKAEQRKSALARAPPLENAARFECFCDGDHESKQFVGEEKQMKRVFSAVATVAAILAAVACATSFS